MKRTRFFLAMLVMVVALIAVGCRNEKPDQEQEKRMEQQEFEKNLLSYPSTFKPFLSEVLNNISVEEKLSLGMLKLEKGMDITYEKEMKLSRIKTFSLNKGKLSRDVYCLYKNKKTFLMDGARVIVHGKVSVKSFTLELFKEEWKKDELQPILRKYPLTVYIPMGDYHVPALESYEEFMDVWDPDNDVVFYMGEPRPDFIAWEGNKPYLIEKSGEFWNEHK